MAYEHKENSGSLFKNVNKASDNHPNANGKCNIEGVLYYVDAWTNTLPSGDKVQNLKFKRVEARSYDPRTDSHQRPMTTAEAIDDDLPF